MQDPPSQPCPRRNAIVEISHYDDFVVLPRKDLSIIPRNTVNNVPTTVGTASSTETTGDATFFSSVVTREANGSVAVETDGAQTATHLHSGTATGTGKASKETDGEMGGAMRERIEMMVVLLVGVAFAVAVLF
ncbi:hypothetical protein J1614_006918 [Plenodomus biglobosus]|nr:hypothetical protein J1614_006918 [Plenodomus biglobosus]